MTPIPTGQNTEGRESQSTTGYHKLINESTTSALRGIERAEKTNSPVHGLERKVSIADHVKKLIKLNGLTQKGKTPKRSMNISPLRPHTNKYYGDLKATESRLHKLETSGEIL